MRNDQSSWTTTLLGEEPVEGGAYVLGGTEYVFKGGMLRQGMQQTPAEKQTADAFGFKWGRRDSYSSEAAQSTTREWLLKRYFGGDGEMIRQYCRPGAAVLDAGCGAGRTAVLLMKEVMNEIRYLGVDFSDAVDVARSTFAEEGLQGEFLKGDFTNLPFQSPTFDVILAEGTLHHTPSVEHALRYLSGLLRPGGYFLFYVYRKKGPVREFTDDLIRQHLSSMTDEEAWEALMPLTQIGKALGELDVTITVPEDIPFLGVSSGPTDVQRLFYWHVVKAFHHPQWTIEEMNHVNYDWFRPLHAYRHSVEEVETWCREVGLVIERIDVEQAGITVVARRQSAVE